MQMFCQNEYSNFYLLQFESKTPKKYFHMSVTSLVFGSFSFLLLMGAWISYLNIYTVLAQAVTIPIAIGFGLFARKLEPRADRGIWISGISLASAALALLATNIIVLELLDI